MGFDLDQGSEIDIWWEKRAWLVSWNWFCFWITAVRTYVWAVVLLHWQHSSLGWLQPVHVRGAIPLMNWLVCGERLWAWVSPFCSFQLPTLYLLVSTTFIVFCPVPIGIVLARAFDTSSQVGSSVQWLALARGLGGWIQCFALPLFSVCLWLSRRRRRNSSHLASAVMN